MLDLVRNTPPVYTEQSRDFQLFLRLYEANLDSVKNDVDLLKYSTDTKNCKTELLPLLSTKLGFDTNYSMNMDMLRSVLQGFPNLLQNKGSITSINQSINLFLQTLNVKTDLLIFYADTGQITLKHGISDHTILIGINEAISNFYVLDELMRYILPAGFGFSFFFFKQYNRTSWLRDLHKINLIYVGEQYADSIRYPMYDESKQYKVGDMVTYYKYPEPDIFEVEEDKIHVPFEVLINTEERGKLIVSSSTQVDITNNVYRCIKDTTGNWDDSCWEFDLVGSRLLNAVDMLQIYGEHSNKELLQGEHIFYDEENYDLPVDEEPLENNKDKE